MRGAADTMLVVMPVSRSMIGGMAQPGSTSIANSPTISPSRTLTAPISVIPSACGRPPVVSRSTTTNVHSLSGVPRSSKEPCRPFSVRGVVVMTRTVGASTDSALPCSLGAVSFLLP